MKFNQIPFSSFGVKVGAVAFGTQTRPPRYALASGILYTERIKTKQKKNAAV
jgi:hypothetical protein